jgi:hypothetical protein
MVRRFFHTHRASKQAPSRMRVLLPGSGTVGGLLSSHGGLPLLCPYPGVPGSHGGLPLPWPNPGPLPLNSIVLLLLLLIICEESTTHFKSVKCNQTCDQTRDQTRDLTCDSTCDSTCESTCDSSCDLTCESTGFRSDLLSVIAYHVSSSTRFSRSSSYSFSAK